MMSNPCFLSTSSSLTREFQQKCPRQQQRKTKKTSILNAIAVCSTQIPWQFLTEASPLQRQPITADNQHEEYCFRANICKFEERTL